MTIGDNIRKIREEKGMTQKELADKCNVIYQTIGKYERNLLNPKFETLDRIAEALDVPVFELFANTEILDDHSIIFFSDEDEKKYNSSVEKQGIELICELIQKKYDMLLNDTDGINIYLGSTLMSDYKVLSSDELKNIEKEVLDYLEFLVDKSLKNKELQKG